MASKHGNIKPLSSSAKVKFMLFADSGVGKTQLIGTAPKTLVIRPPASNMDSIEKPSNVEEWVVNLHSDLDDVHEYLQQTGGGGYDWVWCEDLSILQDYLLDDIWQQVLAVRPKRAEWGVDKGEYQRNAMRISEWIRNMCALADQGNFHFGITCHPAELPPGKEEPEEDADKIKPYIQVKNMPNKICGYMNVVGYYHVVTREGKDDVRVLRVQETDKFVAKDLFKAIEGGKMVDPTIPKIMKAIKAKRPAVGKNKPRRTGAAGRGQSKKRPKRRTRR